MDPLHVPKRTGSTQTPAAQWAALDARWEEIFATEQRRWKGVSPLKEGVEPGQTQWEEALADMRDARKWREIEQSPGYQRYLRERERDIYEPTPEECGWAEEQRFYNEQDPCSEWYREDLYHGAPGPDVVRDWRHGEAPPEDEDYTEVE